MTTGLMHHDFQPHFVRVGDSLDKDRLFQAPERLDERRSCAAGDADDRDPATGT